MSHGSIVFVAGLVALTAAIVTAYANWRSAGTAKLVERFRSGLPLLAGSAAGVIASVLFAGAIARGDRFYYSSGQVVSLFFGVLVAQMLVLFPGSSAKSVWWIQLLFQFIASGIAVLAGVKFDIIKFFPGPLGWWAVPLTMLWLVLATNIVRLLDGLEGGAPLLLAATAGVVLFGAWTHDEYVLSALCAVLLGAALGGLRFHISPPRLPVRGPATALFGFSFAVLTVLARQKTVTLLLLVFPLALIMLVIAGATLGFLERILMLDKQNNDER